MAPAVAPAATVQEIEPAPRLPVCTERLALTISTIRPQLRGTLE
jgi:hypothetical protein